MTSASQSRDTGTGTMAGWIAVIVLAALRASALAQGAIAVAAESGGHGRLVSAWLLAALAAASAATFARAARRLATGHPRWPFDSVNVCVEVATGAAALLILASVTPDATRVGFWALSYTVISAVIVAAASSPPWLGFGGAACLAGAYLASVVPAVAGSTSATPGSIAAAYTNAFSYLAFYALALLGFRLLRSIAGQAESLSAELRKLSEERARLAVAGRVGQIGHDIAKALLREVRLADLPAATLREQAPRFRADLLAALDADPRVPVDLRAEVERIADTYAMAIPLQVTVAEMAAQPPGIPARLIAEATRELLNNASYHRYGYPAWVTGRAGPDYVELSVRNGGPGIDPRRLADAWERKRNIVHQLRLAGGSYQISSSPESDGTTVTIRYPASTATADAASGRTAL
jgi:hypothetical protein